MKKKSSLEKTSTETARNTIKSKPKILIGILGGGGLLLMLLSFGLFGWLKLSENKFLPNSGVSGVEVGGMNAQQALEHVQNELGSSFDWVLEWGTNKFDLKGEEISYTPDINSGIENLKQRQESLPVFAKIKSLSGFDKQKYDENISYRVDLQALDAFVGKVTETLDIPAQEPQITYDSTNRSVTVTHGEDGRQVDTTKLREKLFAVFANPATKKVEIPVVELRPKLTDTQAQTAKNRAQMLIDKTVVASVSGEGVSWTVDTEELITWVDPAGMGWKQAMIDVWVEEIAVAVDRPAQNASFRFVGVGKVEEFKPEKKGLKVVKQQLKDEVLLGLTKLEKSDLKQAEIVIPTQITIPEVTAGDVNGLGIRELIGKGESWYAGSITNRIFNLKKAAEALSGVLIPPGETFSFNKTVGEISQATGYKSAFIIKDGKTILGDGGGVCQTSSTLFRTVLNAGLPVNERTAHAYRVSYYEQNYQPGFDATIFQPAPDLKFTNDTPGHVLIQMVFDEQKKYLAFELYGTSDGRIAEVSKARTWDVVSPPPDLYIDDPNLPVGKVVQTEHAARGAKVAFDWKVTRNGEVLQERTFFSNYRPWQAVYLRGTKTN